METANFLKELETTKNSEGIFSKNNNSVKGAFYLLASQITNTNCKAHDALTNWAYDELFYTDGNDSEGNFNCLKLTKSEWEELIKVYL